MAQSFDSRVINERFVELVEQNERLSLSPRPLYLAIETRALYEFWQHDCCTVLIGLFGKSPYIV